MIVAFLLIGLFVLPATALAGPSPSGGGSAPNPGNVTPWVKQVPGSPGGTTSQGSNVPRDASTKQPKRMADPCAGASRTPGAPAQADCPDATRK